MTLRQCEPRSSARGPPLRKRRREWIDARKRHDDCHPIATEAREESDAPARPNPFAALAQFKGERKPH